MKNSEQSPMQVVETLGENIPAPLLRLFAKIDYVFGNAVQQLPAWLDLIATQINVLAK